MLEKPTDALPQTDHRRAILLFDGVCNLCNGAVQWLIAHDPAAKLQFASLQSSAGRELLQSRGVSEPPESMVLVDSTGVHTRSDAVIRVARYLGFPWSLAVVATILPRFIRDGLYTCVARNRYRWFGRQNACMVPTPDVKARFLVGDATDTPFVAPAQPPTPESTPTPAFSGVFGTWIHRFLLVYLVLYCIPFPLAELPYCHHAATWYDGGKQNAVTWVAATLFKKTITVYPNGSGDTTYNYIELATLVTIAVVLSAIWLAITFGRPIGLRTQLFANVYLRYCLAATMLGYGWAKLMPVQMPYPGPDRLLSSLADTSPMGMLWTFMGASTAYQMLAGASEVIGGLLLLFRRTTLLGALVCAGVMTNVVALNFCYDVPVKLYSSHLLLIALYLIAPHAMRLAAVLVLNLPAQPIELRPFSFRNRWLRTGQACAKIMLVYLLIAAPIQQNYEFLTTYGMLAPRKPWHGIYTVESFTRDGVADRALPDADRWVRVGLNTTGNGAIQRASGTTRRQRIEVNEEKGEITVLARPDSPPSILRFTMPETGVLILEGSFDGGMITARLKRIDDSAALLTSRGFHWINEYPLNR